MPRANRLCPDILTDHTLELIQGRAHVLQPNIPAVCCTCCRAFPACRRKTPGLLSSSSGSNRLGLLRTQAIKLRDEFIELYRKAGPNLSSEKLKDAKLGWDDIFEEIPIVVHNSPLVTALMAQVRCAGRECCSSTAISFGYLTD